MSAMRLRPEPRPKSPEGRQKRTLLLREVARRQAKVT